MFCSKAGSQANGGACLGLYQRRIQGGGGLEGWQPIPNGICASKGQRRQFSETVLLAPRRNLGAIRLPLSDGALSLSTISAIKWRPMMTDASSFTDRVRHHWRRKGAIIGEKGPSRE